jgi:phage regulator Rha-like protein
MSALTIREDMTVDSVTVAMECGIEHKAALQLLKVHGPKIESKFGRVTFEMRPFTTNGGTQKRRIAHLTEDQATAFITLFQNTEKVVDFKFALVAAFSDAKRRLRNSPMTDEQISNWAVSKFLKNARPACEYGALTKDGRKRDKFRKPTYTATGNKTSAALQVASALMVLDQYLPGFQFALEGGPQQ